jgi:hypothetical protein
MRLEGGCSNAAMARSRVRARESASNTYGSGGCGRRAASGAAHRADEHGVPRVTSGSAAAPNRGDSKAAKTATRLAASYNAKSASKFSGRFSSVYYGAKAFSRFNAVDRERQLEEALRLEDPITDIPMAMEVNYSNSTTTIHFLRPLRVHWKARMLCLRCFPEHCRTPPGNPPRPRATALTKAFSCSGTLGCCVPVVGP